MKHLDAWEKVTGRKPPAYAKHFMFEQRRLRAHDMKDENNGGEAEDRWQRGMRGIDGSLRPSRGGGHLMHRQAQE